MTTEKKSSDYASDVKKNPKDSEKKREGKELDKELKDTFPASDPPSIVQPGKNFDR